jgi:hypothetical protein
VDATPGPEPVDHGAGPEPVDEGGPSLTRGSTSEDGGVGEADQAVGRAAEPAGRAPIDGGPTEAGSEAEDGEPTEGKDPLRFNSWMKRSTAGAVMTGIAVGLQQALELPRQQPAFVIEAAGEPEDPDRPIDLRFDPDSPADTVAIIRRPQTPPVVDERTEAGGPDGPA